MKDFLALWPPFSMAHAVNIFLPVVLSGLISLLIANSLPRSFWKEKEIAQRKEAASFCHEQCILFLANVRRMLGVFQGQDLNSSPPEKITEILNSDKFILDQISMDASIHRAKAILDAEDEKLIRSVSHFGVKMMFKINDTIMPWNNCRDSSSSPQKLNEIIISGHDEANKLAETVTAQFSPKIRFHRQKR